jgi:hypothetical protein
MRKRRLQHLILALAVVQAILAARMIQLQVIEHETWAERARRSRLEKRTIPAERGRIFDAEGVVLAEDRRSFDLMLEYRAFRRGQPIAQLFELCLLLGEPCSGLQAAAEDSERLVERALAWKPTQFTGLGSRRLGDALYYLRRLAGFSRTRANELEQWARDSNLPFGQAFPEAGPAMRISLAASRDRLRDLERLLGLDLQDPLLERLEFERQGLERRIRQQAVRTAAAEALGWGAWEVKAQLAADRAPADEAKNAPGEWNACLLCKTWPAAGDGHAPKPSWPPWWHRPARTPRARNSSGSCLCRSKPMPKPMLLACAANSLRACIATAWPVWCAASTLKSSTVSAKIRRASRVCRSSSLRIDFIPRTLSRS